MSNHPHHCAKCPSRWAGSLTSHCTGCHLTFTGITAWEKHRDGTHSSRRGRFCVPPEQSGLVLTSRLYPCWGIPDDTSDDEFLEFTDADS